MPKERFKLLAATYLILEKNGKILLHLRQNSGYADGLYSLVAGHIDGNEPASLAMIREAREEAGITILKKDLEPVHTMHRISKDGKEYIDLYFKSSCWKGQIINMEPQKCKELIFADPKNLPKNMLEHVKLAIESIYNKNFYSEEF